MANMVYANPGGSAVEGVHAGLQDTLQAAEAARKLRGEDNAYDFLKWYTQPAQREQLNTQAGMEKLKALAALSHYTGNYDLVNNAANQYFGVSPDSLPRYAPGAQQRALDLATGGLPIPYAYSDVGVANGVKRALPESGQQAQTQHLSPEDENLRKLMYQLQVLKHQHQIDSYSNPAATSGAARNPYALPTIEEGFQKLKPATPQPQQGISTPTQNMTPAPTFALPEGTNGSTFLSDYKPNHRPELNIWGGGEEPEAKANDNASEEGEG